MRLAILTFATSEKYKVTACRASAKGTRGRTAQRRQSCHGPHALVVEEKRRTDFVAAGGVQRCWQLLASSPFQGMGALLVQPISLVAPTKAAADRKCRAHSVVAAAAGKRHDTSAQPADHAAGVHGGWLRQAHPLAAHVPLTKHKGVPLVGVHEHLVDKHYQHRGGYVAQPC